MRSRLERVRPYLVLFAVSFLLWYAGVRLRGGSGVLDHSPIDQHTRQAQAWLAGRLDLPGAPGYLEIARYQDRFYDSFPPTPSLFELPLALVFGRQTPSSLSIYLLWLGALCAAYAVLRRRRFSERDAVLASLAFVFATNLYVSCSRANVWAQGLSLGFSLAVLGLVFVVHNPRRGGRGPGPGYLLLALAVGCRPLLLLMAPLYVALDHRTCGRSLRQAVVSAVAWMAPFGAFLAWLNWARFGDPMEFGHRHLAFAQNLPHGLMSPHYLPWHLYHAVLKLPRLQAHWPPLEFDMNGTAFWLHNPVLVAALWGLVTRRFDPWIRAAAAFAFVTIGAGILMYESGGWVQFGFRYIIDLLPAGFVVFAFAFDRFPRPLLAASLVAFALNVYGLAGWKHFPRQPRDAPWLQGAPESPHRPISANRCRKSYPELARPVEEHDRNVRGRDRRVKPVEGDEAVAESEEDRAGEGGPFPEGGRAPTSDPRGGPPEHGADGERVGQERRPQVPEARP